MTIEQILEIVEKYKLRMPPTTFYELKADIVNFEEPTTKNNFRDCKSCSHSKDGKCAGTEECHECMWNSKYTTKNNLGVDCISRKQAIDAFPDLLPNIGYNKKAITEILQEVPSVTPQLSVSEVTALAEWTEKLTKASEDAYNKGYADGMKAQEPKTGEWIEHFDESGKWYECDQCHTDWGGAVNFCPNCGADMREVEE